MRRDGRPKGLVRRTGETDHIQTAGCELGDAVAGPLLDIGAHALRLGPLGHAGNTTFLESTDAEVSAIVTGMGAEPQTPEELDALLEDAFVLRDAELVAAMFEPGAVLVADREVHSAQRIAAAVAAMWRQDRTYLAGLRRVVQARNVALTISEQAITVMHRMDDGNWRFAVALLDLDQHPSKWRHTMSDANKKIVRREVEELLERGNWTLLEELISEDYVSHDPALPAPIRGRDGLRTVAEGYRTGLGGPRVRIEDQVAEGDTVVTRWTATGRHEGELFGVPPTGRDLTVTGISIERIHGGQIVEDWTIWDALGLMRQLGVVPDATAAPQ